jgi:hypothetical protein
MGHQRFQIPFWRSCVSDGHRSGARCDLFHYDRFAMRKIILVANDAKDLKRLIKNARFSSLSTPQA